MPPFSLSVESFTPPKLPPSCEQLSAFDIRSPLIPTALALTSPMCFSILLPFARDTKNPLYPATHLQLTYRFEGTGEIFVPSVIASDMLVPSASSHVYEIDIPSRDIGRLKVNHGATSTAEVLLCAWRGEKLLDKWTIGWIENLGSEGLKSTELAILRAETWRRAREGTK